MGSQVTREWAHALNSEFSIQAGDADSKAKLALTKFSRVGSGKYRQLQMEVSVPFDSDEQNEVDVGTLSGLSAGTSVSFEIGSISWPSFTDEQEDSYKNLCQEYFAKLIPGFTWKQISIYGADTENSLTAPVVTLLWR